MNGIGESSGTGAGSLSTREQTRPISSSARMESFTRESGDNSDVAAWSAEYSARVLPQLDRLQSGVQAAAQGGVTVMRSTQLDAQRLDEELKSMIHEQLARSLSLVNPHWMGRLQPEIATSLDLAFFLLTVWRGKPTPGMTLMNLRFRDENRSNAQSGGRHGLEGPGLSHRQRVVYGLVTVAGNYAWRRLNQHAVSQHWRDAEEGSWRRRGWRLLMLSDNVVQTARLANFLVFIRTGDYRTVLERLLRARLLYSQPTMQRAISFEYLNRQLIWQELSELILNILPLVNPEKLRGVMLRWLPPVTASNGSTGLTSLKSQRSPQSCPICDASEILIPFAAVPCKHVFCYYCIRSRTEADRNYGCPSCGQRVAALQRLDRRPSSPSAAAKGVSPPGAQ